MGSETAIHEIKQDIGELKGRVCGIETSVQAVDDSLKLLLERNALLAEMHRILIHHDKRLSAIESRCAARGVEHDTFNDHIANDTSVEAYAGSKALAAWCAIGGIIAGSLIPKLVERLF